MIKTGIKLIKNSGEILDFPDCFSTQELQPFNKYENHFTRVNFKFKIKNNTKLLLSKVEKDDVLQINLINFHIVEKFYDYKINQALDYKKGLGSITNYLILEGVLLKQFSLTTKKIWQIEKYKVLSNLGIKKYGTTLEENKLLWFQFSNKVGDKINSGLWWFVLLDRETGDSRLWHLKIVKRNNIL